LATLEIESNLEKVRLRITRACERAGRNPAGVTLVAVTKNVPAEDIEAAFKLGVRHFGENRVQEARHKIPLLGSLQPKPVWHMIGHLQSNKVKAALEIFDVIQSVDSLALANIINRKATCKVPVLLEINIAGEPAKYGFSPEEIVLAFEQISQLPNLDIKGLMTVAPIVSNPEDVRPIFRRLKLMADAFHLEHISMGMSDDFEVAVEEGATVVRIGRAIFGERSKRP
jgi:pyridoxal phosphate enzyme (YggS family)